MGLGQLIMGSTCIFTSSSSFDGFGADCFVKPMLEMMPWWLVNGFVFVQNLVEAVLVLFLRSGLLCAGFVKHERAS